MLIDEIKKANMEALKTKNSNARAIYSVLINKYMIQQIEKRTKNEDMGDVDTISLIQKTLKELSDEKDNFMKVNNQTRIASIIEQENFLKVFLPKMLTDEEIKKEIEDLQDKSIPSIMRHFKSNYAGKVDMQKVNLIAKTYQG